MKDWRHYKVDDMPERISGDWWIQKYSVSKSDEELQRLRCAINPQRPQRVVPAGDYTRLMYMSTTVMSDTPDEIFDHMDAIDTAKGHCLIAGLGLSIVARAVAEKQEVDKVTVIEISDDVIDLVGDYAVAGYEDKMEIVHADIFDWEPPKGLRYGMVWFDIWEHISEDNLEEMAILKRRFGRRTDWQGCWQQEGCIAQRDRIRNGWGY